MLIHNQLFLNGLLHQLKYFRVLSPCELFRFNVNIQEQLIFNK